MGADPEFTLLFNNSKVSACELFMNIGTRDTQNLKESSMGYTAGKNGDFGWDGHNVTGELRPAPSNNPVEVAQNIGELLRTINKSVPYLDMVVNNNYGSVGGHVHLSFPDDLLKKMKTTEGKNRTTARIHRLLTYFCLPIFAGEDQINAALRRRNNCAYGQLDDYRVEKHGNTLLYEFRPMSAEWIMYPKLCQAVLAYIGVVYNEIVTNPKIDQAQPPIVNTKQLNSLAPLLDYNMKFLLDPCLSDIANRVRKFAAYGDWKKEVNYVLASAKVKSDKAKYKFSLNQGWRLPSLTKSEPTLAGLQDERSARELMNNMDIEPFLGITKLLYNNDINVAAIVQDIKLRMVANQWTPKCEFILFGVRKGIENFVIGHSTDPYNTPDIVPGEAVKTKQDYHATISTLKHLKQRFQDYARSGRDVVYVGIPHALRINNQTNEIIAKLWELDNTTEFTEVNIDNLTDNKQVQLKAVEEVVVSSVANHEAETNRECADARNAAREIIENTTSDQTTCAVS